MLIIVVTMNVTKSDDDDDELMCQFFSRDSCDWHLYLSRFTQKLPALKSKLDQHLYACSYETIAKMLQLQQQTKYGDFINKETNVSQTQPPPSVLLDKWLYETMCQPSSSLVQMIKIFLTNYEQDEIRINSLILSLCEYIRVYFSQSRSTVKSGHFLYSQTGSSCVQLVRICVEQMQVCEMDKFRNLNKLAILIKLVGSLLHTTTNEEPTEASPKSPADDETNQLFVKLMKSLVQVQLRSFTFFC